LIVGKVKFFGLATLITMGLLTTIFSSVLAQAISSLNCASDSTGLSVNSGKPVGINSLSVNNEGGSYRVQGNKQTAGSASESGSGNCPVSSADNLTNRPTLPPDDRLNWRGGDHLAVILPGSSSTGEPLLDVYSVSDTGANDYLFTLEAADTANFTNNPPATNTLLKAEGNASAYMLTSGEIQIRIGPDADGTVYVTVVDGLPWTKVYGLTINS
jgi:hypothetical protein